jgi:glycerol-3-phosphate O-acyltransferase/dihydroxyacetone phosphate acyltransferase
VKLQGRDVIGSWKVLVSLGMAPVLYSFYVAVAIALSFRYNLPLKYKIWAPIWTVFALPAVGYSALKFGEVGMDLYK